MKFGLVHIPTSKLLADPDTGATKSCKTLFAWPFEERPVPESELLGVHLWDRPELVAEWKNRHLAQGPWALWRIPETLEESAILKEQMEAMSESMTASLH